MFDSEKHEAPLVIDFSAAGNAKRFCGRGWATAETYHTWSIGAETTLDLPCPRIPGTYFLILEVFACLHAEKLPAQRLTVLFNDSKIGRAHV